MIPAVEVKDVSYRRNGTLILDRVSFRVQEGDMYAIIGPNGGGKTTLLKIILGLLTPNTGEVSLFGNPPEIGRFQAGYVPQFRTFDFRYPITVREMVISGRLSYIRGATRRYRKEDYDVTDEVLEKLDLLRLSGHSLSHLSGGEQQRVILARALVGKPRLLVLDEPTVYVDTPTEIQFFDILDDLKRSMTILLVSHDIGVISAHVTKVACLNQTLHTHDTPGITEDMIAATYRCPVDLIAHGLPHRVLREHHRREEP